MIVQLVTVAAIATIICAFAAWRIQSAYPDTFRKAPTLALSAWVVVNVLIGLILSFAAAWLIFFITT